MKLNRFRIHYRKPCPQNQSQSIAGVLAAVCGNFKDLTAPPGGQHRRFGLDVYDFACLLFEDDAPDALVILKHKLDSHSLIDKRNTPF